MGVRLLQRLGAHGRRRRSLRGGAAARRPAVGARVAAGRLAARRLDARPAPPAAADSGALAVYADLRELCDGHANDIVVTAEGRAYVGNFGFDLDREEPRPTRLVCVDADGSAHEAADGLLFPNGSVVTPDARTLIVGETFGRRYTAFSIEADGDALRPPTLGRPRPRADRARTAARSTRRAGSGPPTRGTAAAAASPRAARCSTRSPSPRACAASPACSAARTGERSSSARRPTTTRSAEPPAREAVLLTTRVEVPHAGLP